MLLSLLPVHVFANESAGNEDIPGAEEYLETFLYDSEGNLIVPEDTSNNLDDLEDEVKEDFDDSNESNCTCGSIYDVHDDTCVLYVFIEDGADDACSCGGVDGQHNEGCEENQSCDCEGDTHLEGCIFYEGDISDCTCNTETEVHDSNCPLYEEIAVEPVCTCEGETHVETCYLYEEPVIDDPECECEGEHVEDCPLYEADIPVE